MSLSHPYYDIPLNIPPTPFSLYPCHTIYSTHLHPYHTLVSISLSPLFSPTLIPLTPSLLHPHHSDPLSSIFISTAPTLT